jgi:hypothetical protein
MHIVYYITGHGYGHGVRGSALCNALEPSVRLSFRTALPRRFFEEEIARPFAYHAVEYDCGCIQNDSLSVDIEKTLQSYMDIARRNSRLFEQEVRQVRDMGPDAIISDITPFAFEVAREAGVASIAVTNFTWYDIYEPYVSVQPSFRPYLDHMARQYSLADLVIALSPANAMEPFTAARYFASVIGRSGRDRGMELRDRFAIPVSKRIGLIYAGTFGLDSIDWSNLAQFKDWEFIGVYPLPNQAGNYHLVNKSEFRYQDLMASVDCVITKIGYGVYAECLLHGLPLIYAPRKDFAEHAILEQGVKTWGGAIRLEEQPFLALQWHDALKRVARMNPPAPKANAAPHVAGLVQDFVRARNGG